MKVHLEHQEYWHISDDVYVRGSPFLNGEKISNELLCDKLNSCNTADEVQNIITRLNGPFSIIYNDSKKDKLYIIVDHIRHYPLFYKYENGIKISDSAEKIHDGENHQFDKCVEYLFCGYIPGNYTLGQYVYQMQAGEIVEINTATQQVTKRDRHYVFYPNPENANDDTHELQTVLERSIERLIDYADGRQIVLGLSGGVDSRLIALLIYKKGYENVLTYTHDVPSGSSTDIPLAHSLAEELGFEHEVVRHTHSDYWKLHNGDKWDELINHDGYMARSLSVTSMVNHMKLKKSGAVADNPVVVKGLHPLGLGYYVSEKYQNLDRVSKESFINILWDGHYNLYRASDPVTSTLAEGFKDQILEKIPVDVYSNSNQETTSEALGAVETYYWQERVAKSSITGYWHDYFHYDRWFPLLDKEYLNELEKVGYEKRIGKKAQKKVLETLEKEVLSEEKFQSDRSKYAKAKKYIWDELTGLYINSPRSIQKILIRFYQSLSEEDYESDPRYGLMNKEEFSKLNLNRTHYKPLIFTILHQDGYIRPHNDQKFNALYQSRS